MGVSETRPMRSEPRQPPWPTISIESKSERCELIGKLRRGDQVRVIMIFIGEGALLKRAVSFATASGFRVDAVYTRSQELAQFCRLRRVAVCFATDLNREWERLVSVCSDGLVFSINNSQLFRGAALADTGVKIFNVHNGPIPAYRGRPEVCVMFALLHGEMEYGVTLHEVDAGIDTGSTLNVLRFPIAPSDDFESLMLRAVDACDELFRASLAAVVAGRLVPLTRARSGSRLYRLRDLRQLWEFRHSPNLKRATRFGAFESAFPESWAIVREELQRIGQQTEARS